MQIKISTLVASPLQRVIEGFDERLFLKLNPPFPLVKLKRFDGCLTGDKVWIELNFILFRQQWHAEIIEQASSEKRFYFVDKGERLPFFLKDWHHQHTLESDGEQTTLITDNIHFSTGTIVGDVLVFPLLWLQFLYRKPIYRKHFQ